MQTFNSYELQILQVMLFSGEIRHKDINVTHMTTDKFTYHLKKLVADGFIEKTNERLYRLTEQGKSMAGKMDGYTSKFEELPKTIVIGICRKKVNGQVLYAIQRRSKQPHRDYYCLPGGKCRAGENLLDAVQREVLEETGLKGDPRLVEIRHAIKLSKGTSSLIADDIFYAYHFQNVEGELIGENAEGKNSWLSLEEIASFDRVVRNTIPTIHASSNKTVRFLEEVQYYDS